MMLSKISKKLKKFIPGLIIIALLAGGFLYFSIKNSVTKVTATKAEVRTISKTISTSGETGVSDGSTVRALIGGNIKDLKFKSGDQIKKDDIVLEMDRASLKASLDTSYSAYLSAKSDIDSYDQKVVAAKATESVRKRERDEAWRNYMADSGETEKQAYKNADALYQSALSSLNVLEDGKKATQNAVYSGYSTYYSALNNYNNSTIKAPADGQLALADIYNGSYVASGQELFSVVSLQNIVFKAEIDEADISHMKVGMKAKVSLDSYPGEFFEGEVTNIDAKVRVLPSGSTVVSGDVSFKDNKILPILKLSGSADIEIDKSDALVSVTPDSIFDEADKKYVYVVVADTLVKKAVEVGFEGDEYVGLISGVNEGDLVVTELSGVNLKAGQKVKL
jgi:RND family efflux transporter MFP subunit